MVSWIFLIKSSFVALLGIGLGAGLALIPAAQMITDMAVEIPGLVFRVPGQRNSSLYQGWHMPCHC